MVMKIEGKIIAAELVQHSDEDLVKIRNAELEAENNSLKKELMKLRRLSQTSVVSGQPPGGV